MIKIGLQTTIESRAAIWVVALEVDVKGTTYSVNLFRTESALHYPIYMISPYHKNYKSTEKPQRLLLEWAGLTKIQNEQK